MISLSYSRCIHVHVYTHYSWAIKQSNCHSTKTEESHSDSSQCRTSVVYYLFTFSSLPFKGGRTLRPRIFAAQCLCKTTRKLLVVQISNLHKTLKSWTTSTHSKNHNERTNGSYFISCWRFKIKNNRTQQLLVLASCFFLYSYSVRSSTKLQGVFCYIDFTFLIIRHNWCGMSHK